MLGWEFPPHISGGLGTACRGLTRGLARAGVDVLFVVPHAYGDEDATDARIVGCDGWKTARGAAARASSSKRGDAPATDAPARLRVLAVKSALHPYLGASSYRERLHHPHGEKSLRSRPARQAASGGEFDEPDTACDVAFRCSANYGPDLFAEVDRYAAAVAEIAQLHQFDVVHAHDWMTYPAGIAAARATRSPLVVHVHACEHDRCGDGADERIEAIERAGLDAAELVVCVSRYTAEIVRRRYAVDPAKLRVVHNALLQDGDGGHVADDGAIDDPIVLFLGRVTFQKGPEYFLRAAARVAAALPDAKFVVSGNGDMLATTVELAAALGIARNVHFTGFLRGTDVARMYRMSDVYVMPSVSEPFGITALEAAALGVPVVVSKNSGVREVLGSVLAADFWDIDDLADKIFALLSRSALREDIARGGRSEARAARWETRGEELRRIYEEVLT